MVPRSRQTWGQDTQIFYWDSDKLGIHMRLLRKLKAPLLPAIQHLVNTTLISTEYPTVLKHTKIVPLLKKGKDQTLTKSYRGVNLIPSLAKVIDKSLLIQLLNHMETNHLIPHQHHGGIANNGTATALATLIDTWSTKMEQGEDAIALIMDQSLAYDLVDHAILLQKMEAIGLDKHSMKLMQSYLENRTQSVQVETFTSPPLHAGPRSVIQGSALSCILYIIFTLDLPWFLTVTQFKSHIKSHQTSRSHWPTSTTTSSWSLRTVTWTYRNHWMMQWGEYLNTCPTTNCYLTLTKRS